MKLSLSEIRSKAMEFAAEWREGANERADAQTFWNDFFAVFGFKRRIVASFEVKVKNLSGSFDRIDVFYPGKMLGEHKSRGEDLSKAATQAFRYVESLINEGRFDEVPQYIVVSDFANIVLYDLESKDPSAPVVAFPTARLHENIRYFGFLSGYESKPVSPEDPINIRAVEILGELHDALEAGGYSGHRLERFLVRILFCLFADDTGIFDPDTFKLMVRETRSDGSDLGAMLARLFSVLNAPREGRSEKTPDEFKELPYVNGALFAEDLGFAEFDSRMRAALEKCCDFNWARISPAVFGSLFQSIMDGGARRQIGAHYTSERDIMKVVRSLFLDDLHAEFKKCKGNKRKLTALHHKLADLKFLDPACGCGNFLVVTYRELRLLELEILKSLNGDAWEQNRLDTLLLIDVDQMHGIEIEEWPARIAEVAMWLIDHQMNQKVSETFGVPVLRLPLTKSARIHIGNALRVDWNEVLPAEQCSFVLGNPPFVGKQHMTIEQKKDRKEICGSLKGFGILDYVSCWYVVACNYVGGARTRCAFVSTNSVIQGEQASILWPALLHRGLRIVFAHRTFSWMSEAKGKAHVHVVIVGFALYDSENKFIVDYEENEESPTVVLVKNINPYLVEGPDSVIETRARPICDVPRIVFGNMPNDNGHLLLDDEERLTLIKQAPDSASFIKRFFGAREYINNIDRWCIWITDRDMKDARKCAPILKRINEVRRYREKSNRETTRLLAEVPSQFGEIRQPNTSFLLIPRHSSEKRRYIPIGYLEPHIIAGDSCLIIPDATHYHFGVLTSEMHMAWVRHVCGRLESRYRYSNKLVYNNFPWPEKPTGKQIAAVEEAAKGVLAAREAFPDHTLADLYDPLAMPKLLRDAHKKLDRAVDRCYRRQTFESERQRVEYLFGLYQKLTAPIIDMPKKKRRAKKS